MRIFVVDDDPLIRMLLMEFLGAYGHSVDALSSGSECLSKLGTETPDLLILDRQMPEMTGMELLTKLRADPQLDLIPTILLSANAAESETGDGPRADRYLEKPFQMQQLLEAVQSTRRSA